MESQGSVPLYIFLNFCGSSVPRFHSLDEFFSEDLRTEFEWGSTR
jgi:hypothetical protein